MRHFLLQAVQDLHLRVTVLGLKESVSKFLYIPSNFVFQDFFGGPKSVTHFSRSVILNDAAISGVSCIQTFRPSPMGGTAPYNFFRMRLDGVQG